MKINKSAVAATPKATEAKATVPVTAPAKTTEVKAKVAKTASKYVSRDVIPEFGSRARVAEYQDLTFTRNLTKKMTDEELAQDWRAQFPAAVAFTAGHVTGARRDFNAGRHSKRYAGVRHTVPQYAIVNGARVEAVHVPKTKANGKTMTSTVTPPVEVKPTMVKGKVKANVKAAATRAA